MNDLQYALSNCGLRLYADDTVIYTTGKNVKETQEVLQVLLNTFENWCNINALTINTKKTIFHIFCVDFICVWWSTQTQYPVEYGLYCIYREKNTDLHGKCQHFQKKGG